MFEDLKKTIDKGLEYAFMNAEKLAQAAKDLANENKLTKEEAKNLYEHLLSKSEEAKKSVETELQQLIKNTLKKMEVPTQEEIKKLEERIASLESSKKESSRTKLSPQKAAGIKKIVKKPAKPA
ncbi:MAG: phasin family protein [Bacteroidetes bacterium]|nr:phasin family protein [Bacteroidota bacterium]